MSGDAAMSGLSDAVRCARVQCPPISYHLAGTKKVQQELARAGVVERFLPADDAAAVRRSFAGLWGLDDTEPLLVRGVRLCGSSTIGVCVSVALLLVA